LLCDGEDAVVIVEGAVSEPLWICVWMMKDCSAKASTVMNARRRDAVFGRRTLEYLAAATFMKPAIDRSARLYAHRTELRNWRKLRVPAQGPISALPAQADPENIASAGMKSENNAKVIVPEG